MQIPISLAAIKGRTRDSESGVDLRYLFTQSDEDLSIPPKLVLNLKDEVNQSTSSAVFGKPPGLPAPPFTNGCTSRRCPDTIRRGHPSPVQQQYRLLPGCSSPFRLPEDGLRTSSDQLSDLGARSQPSISEVAFGLLKFNGLRGVFGFLC